MSYSHVELNPGSLAYLTQQYRASLNEQLQRMNSVGLETSDNLKSPDKEKGGIAICVPEKTPLSTPDNPMSGMTNLLRASKI